MRYGATEKLLKTARGRLWLQGLIDRGWLGLMLMSGILGLTAVLHTFFIPLTITWWGPAALLPVAIATMTALFNRPSLELSARVADRWLNTHDLLTAAWYLKSHPSSSMSGAAFVVLDQANKVAINTSRSLPRLRNTRYPLPTAGAIAIAAISLFFLSLQGAVSSSRPHHPVAGNSPALAETEEDKWLPVFEPGQADATTVKGNIRAKRKPASLSLVPSNEIPQNASPAREEREQTEPGSSTRSNILQAAKGAGAGRLASMEAPSPAPGGETSDGTATMTDIEFVSLQRKPDNEAVTMDHTKSVGLIPFEIGYQPTAVIAQDVAPARATKVSFSPAVGPAYRALQARYFEETSHND